MCKNCLTNEWPTDRHTDTRTLRYAYTCMIVTNSATAELRKNLAIKMDLKRFLSKITSRRNFLMLYKIKKILTNFRSYIFVTDGNFNTGLEKPEGWFHLVLNYISLADGQGITIYRDGVLQGSGTSKGGTSQSYSPGDGRVVIGRRWTDRDEWYASVEVDELTFWNRTLTLQEIQAIYYMHQ